MTRALRQVDEKVRGELGAIVDGLVGAARSLPAHEFERRLRVEVRRLQGDDDTRQKRSIRWRSWVERISGMFRGDFACDSLNAVKIDKRIQDEVERLFAEHAPDDCPDDPIEKQQYLAGLAVISLLTGNGGGRQARADRGRRRHPGRADGRPTVDWGLPVDLPDDVLRDVAARAKLHVVAVWPPAALDLGRSQRLASAAQRRVLRALYPTCAIPGCEVRFGRTKMHHVWWWEHGGPTDLDNLLPICNRHHSAVHDHGWKLKLLPDRTLEITFPTAPPWRPAHPKGRRDANDGWGR